MTADWVSLHVFHHGDLDRLITMAVGPLVAELRAAGLGDDVFFLRYWEGGPHLRLRIRAARPVDRARVETLAGERLGAYLAGHPSEGRLSPRRYARAAAVLARGEGMTAYTAELQARDSIQPVAYRREHDRYGHGAAMDAVERHFVESSRIALRVLSPGAPAGQRLAAAAAAILVSWFVSEAPEALAGRRAARRVAGPDAAARRMAVLAGQMRRLVAGAGRLPAGGTLVDWVRSTATLRDALTARAAADVPGILDLCAHLLCNRIGVDLAAEDALRGLAAGALRESAETGE